MQIVVWLWRGFLGLLWSLVGSVDGEGRRGSCCLKKGIMRFGG